ncbi:hypothetical protein T4D_8864 [Trichinella pseudospiralis]|uniref:Uncharacterized protein n=1 Tax=Trichinella pseudospiralis TaxID=6337 RepID=A0A0V1F5J3_TRIPS|nr:hypothetical protein T4D_8864 [Trichinella pseudospiralis]
MHETSNSSTNIRNLENCNLSDGKQKQVKIERKKMKQAITQE